MMWLYIYRLHMDEKSEKSTSYFCHWVWTLWPLPTFTNHIQANQKETALLKISPCPSLSLSCFVVASTYLFDEVYVHSNDQIFSPPNMSFFSSEKTSLHFLCKHRHFDGNLNVVFLSGWAFSQYMSMTCTGKVRTVAVLRRGCGQCLFNQRSPMSVLLDPFPNRSRSWSEFLMRDHGDRPGMW